MALDLTGTDFRVSEDGVARKVLSASLEPLPRIIVRDNIGEHFEWSFAPGGKWSTLDSLANGSSDPDAYYAVTYVSASPTRSGCHRIRVKVNRPHTLVWAPNEYCYSAASDPLNGTKFGKRMERDVASKGKGKIPLSAQVASFFTETNAALVDITLEFPWNHLKRSRDYSWHGDVLFDTINATIGALGVIRRMDGTIVERFTDYGCCSADNFVTGRTWDSFSLDNQSPALDDLPTRYETQVHLPPGEYKVEIVLSDGSKFGREEIPIVIDPYKGDDLAISSVALCRRFRYASAAVPEAASVKLAPEYVPLISKGMAFTPSGATIFSTKYLQQEHFLYVYYEVYEPLLKTAPATTVQTRMKITNVSTGAVETDTGLRSAADWVEAGNSVIHISQQIAADKLPKGRYRIEVQADDSAGHSTAWRVATFAVR